MGAKGITLRVRKFDERQGTGKSRDAWLNQYEKNRGNTGVVGIFKDGKEVMSYVGADGEGGVRVRSSEIAKNSDTVVYLTNNQWTGPQMLKDMKTLVNKTGANTLVYRNQDGSEYILHIKKGADRDAIAKRLNSQATILSKNNLATMRGKSKTIADALRPKATGKNKGKYVFNMGSGKKAVVFNTKPSAAQVERLWRLKIAGQTSRTFRKGTFSDTGFVLYKSKGASK